MPLELNTEGIYVCTDAQNGKVTLLLPKSLQAEIFELRLDDPDPESTDAAEFKLLREVMEEHGFDLE
jgi:hypothetical protein